MSEQLQQKFMQLQMVHQQLKMIQEQMQMLEQQSMELDMTKESVKELAEVKKGTTVWVPLANGIFAKALWDSDEFLVNIGAQTAVPKGVEDVNKLIMQQQEEAAKMRNEMMGHAQTLMEMAAALEEELK